MPETRETIENSLKIETLSKEQKEAKKDIIDIKKTLNDISNKLSILISSPPATKRDLDSAKEDIKKNNEDIRKTREDLEWGLFISKNPKKTLIFIIGAYSMAISDLRETAFTLIKNLLL